MAKECKLCIWIWVVRPYARVQTRYPWQVNLDVSYVGSRTIGAGTTRAYNALSVQNLALGDPTKGGDPNYLTAAVPNPFAGLLPGTSLNNATITRQQLLLPFPEFTSFNIQDYNVGKVWYNALQITLQKRYGHGLTLTATYAFAKNLQAMNYLNPQDPLPARTLTPWDRPNRLTLAPIYELPFGPGKAVLGSSRGVVAKLVEGWQVVMAVYGWEMTYEMEGQTYEEAGSDILALARGESGWLITWRAMLPAISD